jgi:endonuclease/exonuclease/phosphatase family metal-dependent hydrolase
MTPRGDTTLDRAVVVPLQRTLLARIAIAHGIRPDGARRELAKAIAGTVELGLAELPIPATAPEAIRHTTALGDCFLTLCGEIVESTAHAAPDEARLTARFLSRLASVIVCEDVTSN